ncbi:SemiSWEET family sugar transporter [Oleisolibacter albus]|uniref:SemiSWEET family sugar transporter n=1 Tax=Oleisolibacter albus TaxID=2171757 RepID=UPI0019607663|nr:hypothetical protein [Oleisolibacter albus]
MEQDWMATAVGLVAGALGSSGFVPQVLKLWRSGDCSAISSRGYAVTVSAFALWVGYGLLIASLPVVLFNSVNFLLSGTILVLTLRSRRRTRACPADGAAARM